MRSEFSRETRTKWYAHTRTLLDPTTLPRLVKSLHNVSIRSWNLIPTWKRVMSKKLLRWTQQLVRMWWHPLTFMQIRTTKFQELRWLMEKLRCNNEQKMKSWTEKYHSSGNYSIPRHRQPRSIKKPQKMVYNKNCQMFTRIISRPRRCKDEQFKNENSISFFFSINNLN